MLLHDPLGVRPFFLGGGGKTQGKPPPPKERKDFLSLLDDAQNRRKRTSTHEWAHEWPHEWVHEWPHESAHESTHEGWFPCFQPSRTPHETSHEGVHGRAHEWTVGVHLCCFHLFCSLTIYRTPSTLKETRSSLQRKQTRKIIKKPRKEGQGNNCQGKTQGQQLKGKIVS